MRGVRDQETERRGDDEQEAALGLIAAADRESLIEVLGLQLAGGRMKEKT